MNYYWINITGSEDEVIDNSFFWAPLPYINDNGHKMNNAGWATLDRVRRGDWFFCKSGADFEFVAVATSDMYKAPRPDNRKSDKPYREGRRVDIELRKLAKPVNARAIIDGLLATGPDACKPVVVTKKGAFHQTYASRLSPAAGKYLLSETGLTAPELTGIRCGTQKIYPHESHSWTIVSDDVMYKTVDTSLIQQFTTGVPLDCIDFFSASLMSAGDRLDITLRIGDNLSSAYLRRNAIGRHVLFLSEAAELLKLRNISADDKLWFERVADQENTYYAYTQTKNSESVVLPPAERAGAPKNTASRATVNIRIGQGYFKSATAAVCGNRCVVTGVADQKPSILIGSHIKPWSESDDTERMDGHNGLLLAPHVDKLFDSYLITFSEEKKICVSPRLPADVLTAWGIDVQKVYPLTDKQLEYMKHHRAVFDALAEKQEKS